MRFAVRWLLPVVVGAMPALAACESDTDIRGEIVLGEPLSLDAIPGEPTSLGLLDDWVLVTSSRPVLDADPDLWGDTVVETLITWIDPEGNIGETTSLGWVRARSGETPRWLAWEGELWASIRAGDPGRPSPEDRDHIRIVSVSPSSGIGCSVRPDLPVLENSMFFTVSTLSGVGGYYPGVLSSRGPVFGLSAIPQACGSPSAERFRPLVISSCGAVSWLPGSSACLTPPLVTGGFQLAAHGDELGVLASSAVDLASDPPSHWERFRDGASVTASVVVGSRRPSGFSGVPIPSLAVLGEHVLWLDATDNEGFCSFVRTMRWDGTEARDAPWQPPCAVVQQSRFHTLDHRRTGTSTDILPLGDVALFVSVDGPTELDANPARAIVQGMTADGRRASPQAVVAEGEVFMTLAATQGTDGVLAYRDESTWALRRITWVGRDS